MRIDANVVGMQGVYNDAVCSGKARQSTPPSTSIDDVASFTTDNLSIADLGAKAMAAPEVRAEKVESLRQQIAAGTYQPDARQIASAMLNNLLAR